MRWPGKFPVKTSQIKSCLGSAVLSELVYEKKYDLIEFKNQEHFSRINLLILSMYSEF